MDLDDEIANVIINNPTDAWSTFIKTAKANGVTLNQIFGYTWSNGFTGTTNKFTSNLSATTIMAYMLRYFFMAQSIESTGDEFEYEYHDPRTVQEMFEDFGTSVFTAGDSNRNDYMYHDPNNTEAWDIMRQKYMSESTNMTANGMELDLDTIPFGDMDISTRNIGVDSAGFYIIPAYDSSRTDFDRDKPWNSGDYSF